MYKFFRMVFISICCLGLLSSTVNAQGNENFSSVAEQFSGENPNSKAKIDHRPFTDYLFDTVFPGGRSKKFLGTLKAKKYSGSNIRIDQALAPSRFEGGRIFLPYFNADQIDFFQTYQEGLENVSNMRAISKFNKNEQLAYWLNLYNVIVINRLIEEYPIQNLKNLMESKKGRVSFKNEKVTRIEGVRLSLKEIENILFTNFESPLVAFGLWQGAIGGPRLLNYAFTAKNVQKELKANAVEFVNSNRGLRPPRGSKMKVSKFYKMMLPAFGTSEDDILSFIKLYADPNFVTGVQQVTSINASIFDWRFADILNGTIHSGKESQFGGLQTANGGGTMDAVGSSVGSSDNTFKPETLYRFILDKNPKGSLVVLPPQVQAFVAGIIENNEVLIPIVFTEE